AYQDLERLFANASFLPGHPIEQWIWDGSAISRRRFLHLHSMLNSTRASGNVDSESRSETSSQPPRFGSDRRRFVHPSHASGTDCAILDRSPAVDSAAFPPDVDQTKVPKAVLRQTRPSGWSERTCQRTHRCRR